MEFEIGKKPESWGKRQTKWLDLRESLPAIGKDEAIFVKREGRKDITSFRNQIAQAFRNDRGWPHKISTSKDLDKDGVWVWIRRDDESQDR